MEDKKCIEDFLTEKCKNELQEVNKDASKLYYFFKGVFQGMGKQQQEIRPSQVLALYAAGLMEIESIVDCKIASAKFYLKKCIAPSIEMLDTGFEKHYKDTKDLQATWEWFADFFGNTVLKAPFEEFKTFLTKEDLEKQQKEGKYPGIYFSFFD